jgi:hypothetical protein
MYWIIIIIICILFFYYINKKPPALSMQKDWKNINGTWKITPNEVILKDKWKTMPEHNGLILKVDMNLDQPGNIDASYSIKYAFCDINSSWGGHLIIPGSQTEFKDTLVIITNTGIDLRSDETVFEFLQMDKNYIMGFMQGATYDTVVDLIRVD